MVFATVAFTIGIAVLFGITTGYLAVSILLRLFGTHAHAASDDTAMLSMPLPTSQPGR